MDFNIRTYLVVDGCNYENKANNFIQNIQLVHQVIQEQFKKSQAKHKARHKNHMVDHDFQVGDQFLLHIIK
jgi:hypothetical protein